MFADDTKMWAKVNDLPDTTSLQPDLGALGTWTERLPLQLNTDKCKIVHIGHNLMTRYYLVDNGVPV